MTTYFQLGVYTKYNKTPGCMFARENGSEIPNKYVREKKSEHKKLQKSLKIMPIADVLELFKFYEGITLHSTQISDSPLPRDSQYKY